ncbi:ribosome biogenesis GTPase Der [uncultured Microscilla sp.]|uniref:ribosome biogenesis GTPase Der n=1 Tax=uncultured Microscilla sp. TaxID=432653 RepID=UPI00260C82EF|nr:ribosome biogenesis GTPase Der [uncultured Microscilla sp.]
MSNIVAIVGRPNVGKSTLFNRLIEQRKSIMDNQSGVTRDRVYGQAEWIGKFFTVIDTGGYVVGSEDVFEGAIREQVEIAIEESSVVLFVVDCITGLTDLDKDFANVLRRGSKPVIIVANKADNIEKEYMASEFYQLGLEGDIFPISAQSGSGSGDLLDEVVKHFDDIEEEDPYAGIPKIAIVGRPNAGKSSLVNVLTGKERSIVTDIAGTTRDSVNTHYKAFGKNFILTDTAGLRRKSRVKDNIEFYSTMRALRSLEASDICIVMVDATRGIEGQDVNIIGLADKNGKGIVIMVNKWDLIEKDTKTAEKFRKDIAEKIAPMTYIPIIFGSVLEKQRIFQVVEKAIEVYDNRNQKISTSELNKMMLPEIEHYPPPAIKGKYIRIKYVTQLPTYKPTFAFFCNLPQYIKESYQRYLENKLRKHFNFEGVPIQLFFRKK